MGSQRQTLHPTTIERNHQKVHREATSLEQALAQSTTRINRNTTTRSEIESELVCFQRAFIGGKNRSLEVFTTGGGTRSINLAFESVLARVRNSSNGGQTNNNGETIKVLTGNPHLAVERAERRFRFQLVRLTEQGALSLPLLQAQVSDLSVAAIYSQTLSYTDGITDPLQEILNVVETENQRRSALNVPLITLINDCCLAFSVLCHAPETRILDLSEHCITPVIVTLDAHKHLGTDKGISSVIGTPGTLSLLTNHVKVGGQPSEDTLIRAMACMKMVGQTNYVKQYQLLGTHVQRVVDAVESLGLTVIHSKNRCKGSTVVSVEDPSGIYKQKMKKCGHTLASLFNVYPNEPKRCQTGWQLSLTPHALREVKGTCALDLFLKDLKASHELIASHSNMYHMVTSVVSENSLLACLCSGNLDPFLLPYLGQFGRARKFMEEFVRRFFTAQMDCGILNSERRRNPAQQLMVAGRRGSIVVFFIALWWILVKRKR